MVPKCDKNGLNHSSVTIPVKCMQPFLSMQDMLSMTLHLHEPAERIRWTFIVLSIFPCIHFCTLNCEYYSLHIAMVLFHSAV